MQQKAELQKKEASNNGRNAQNINASSIKKKSVTQEDILKAIQKIRNNPNSLSRKEIALLQKTIVNQELIRLLSKIGNKQDPQQTKKTIQRKEGMMTSPKSEGENKTGLPEQLKSGIENLSGIDLSDVRVHRNSDKPSQIGALAYTQGNDIHIAPGQKKHLPHESWHVVQQKQGWVRPTIQMKSGVKVNDDEKLEKEADVMGARAVENRKSDAIIRHISSSVKQPNLHDEKIIQRTAKKILKM